MPLLPLVLLPLLLALALRLPGWFLLTLLCCLLCCLRWCLSILISLLSAVRLLALLLLLLCKPLPLLLGPPLGTLLLRPFFILPLLLLHALPACSCLFLLLLLQLLSLSFCCLLLAAAPVLGLLSAVA